MSRRTSDSNPAEGDSPPGVNGTAEAPEEEVEQTTTMADATTTQDEAEEVTRQAEQEQQQDDVADDPHEEDLPVVEEPRDDFASGRITTDEEAELPDGAGSEAAPAAAEPAAHDAMQADAERDGPSAPSSRSRSAGSQTDEQPQQETGAEGTMPPADALEEDQGEVATDAAARDGSVEAARQQQEDELADGVNGPEEEDDDDEDLAVVGEPRAPPSADGIATDDEAELPDSAGSDVRPAAAEPVLYDAIQSDADEAVKPSSRSHSAGSQTDDQPQQQEGEQEGPGTQAADPTVAVVALNPSQGIQADANVDVPSYEKAAAAAAATPAGDVVDGGVVDSKPTAPTAAAAAAAHPAQPQAVQASVGHVTVTAAILPMGCVTVLSLPIPRAVKNALSGGAPAAPGEGCWMLSARGLFEAMATRLCVHPQSFHVRRGSDRVRFQETLVLDVDRTSADALDADGLAARAESVWVSITFPGSAATATTEEGGEEGEEGAVDGGGGGAMAAVPAHLAGLARGEVLQRCIHARLEKPQLRPQTLVEARRSQGLSFTEVIQRSYRYDRGVAGDAGSTAVVAIVLAADHARKPFMGGYRVRDDPGHVLLHASTQLFLRDLSYSPFPDKAFNPGDMCARQTQTLGISRGCQTARECCVQTPSRPHPGTPLLLDHSADYAVVARPYFTAAALHALHVAKAIVAQKMYRCWKARRIRRALEALEAGKQRRGEELQRAEEAALRARELLAHQRLADPRTGADFDRLRDEVIAWSAEEAALVPADATLTPKQRRLALLAITKEGVKLQQELDHRRRLAVLERRDEGFAARLNRTAADKTWGAAGIKVATPETARAGELRDLYTALLVHRGATAESRLDVLLHTKWTVAEFPNAPGAAELAQLIDREADLLHRGRRETSLAGLRRRIEELFKQVITDPAFNPGIAPFTTTAVGRAKVKEILEEKDGTAAARVGASPYGGHAAAGCAVCSPLLRSAVARSGGRQQQRRQLEASKEAAQSVGGGGQGGSGGSGRSGSSTADGRGIPAAAASV